MMWRVCWCCMLVTLLSLTCWRSGKVRSRQCSFYSAVKYKIFMLQYPKERVWSPVTCMGMLAHLSVRSIRVHVIVFFFINSFLGRSGFCESFSHCETMCRVRSEFVYFIRIGDVRTVRYAHCSAEFSILWREIWSKSFLKS